MADYDYDRAATYHPLCDKITWRINTMTEIIVAAITGLLGLLGVVLTNRAGNKQMAAKVDKLAEHDNEQYLSILRLTVMSPDMPISERLIAGKKYIKKGGNGDLKHYYEQLVPYKYILPYVCTVIKMEYCTNFTLIQYICMVIMTN